MIVVSTRPIPPSSSGSRRVDGVEGTPSVVASEDLAGSRVDGVKVVRSVVPTEGGGGAETLLGNSRAQRATSGALRRRRFYHQETVSSPHEARRTSAWPSPSMSTGRASHAQFLDVVSVCKVHDCASLTPGT